MKNRQYILDGTVPVPEPDINKYAAWFKNADRVVAKTDVESGVEVSTVFLGMDHQFGKGPPLLFETKVFGGSDNGRTLRYATWEQAEAGHAAVVSEYVRTSSDPP